MKKTLRTVVAVLLVFVMLFSVSVTTVFAAEKSSTANGSTASNGNSGSFDPITPPTGETANGINLGWISVNYDDDSLDIVWHHRFEAMLNTLSTNPEILKDLSDVLMAGFEHIVSESIGNGATGGNTGNGIVVDINDMEGLLKTAINAYLLIDSNDPNYIETILNFFEKLLGEDMNAANSEARNFSQYVCDLISFAVSSGKITLEELKGKIADGEALKNTIDSKIYDIIDSYAAQYITEELPGLIEGYVASLKNEPNDLSPEIKSFIEDVAISFAKTQAKCYLNGEETKIDGTVIETFIFSQVRVVLEELLPNYASMKKNPGTKFWEPDDVYASAYMTAYNKIDEYVERAIENYIKIICGIDPEKSTVLDDELQQNATVSEAFDGLVSDELDKIIAYIESDRTLAKPATYDIFESALATYFENENTKITDEMLTADYASFLRDNAKAYKDLFEGQFDSEFEKIVDYISGGRVGAKPDNYTVFATLLSDYFEDHKTIDSIPSSILIKYIESNKTTLSQKFGDEFDAEYAKVVAGGASALYEILANAFDKYFDGISFNEIDKALLSEYLDLKGAALKDEFVAAKLAEIKVDDIIDDIVKYVKAKADPAVATPADVPDYYDEFKAEFNAKGFVYMGYTVTIEDAESNIDIANAIFTDENINQFKADFEAEVIDAVETAVENAWPEIVAYAKLENPTTGAPENYALFVSEFNEYLASNAITFDSIGVDFLAKDAVKNFIKESVDFEAELDKIVDYIGGIAQKPESYTVFESVFETYFANNTITLENVSAELIADADIKAAIESVIDFDKEYSAIVAYIENGKIESEKPESYDLFAMAFNAHFANKDITLDLIPDTIPLSFLKSYVSDANKRNTIIAKFKETLKNAQNKEAYYKQISDFVEQSGGIINKVSEQTLNNVINSVSIDTIVSAVENILKDDASYKASFASVIDGLEEKTIVSFLKEMVADQNFDVKTLIEEAKSAFFDQNGNLVLDDETYDAALKSYIKLSKAELDSGILAFENIIAADYDETIYSLENGGASFEMADLIKYLKSISVNGKTIVTFENGTDADKAAIKELLRGSIPTLNELANMSNEELANLLHWEIEIVTAFSGDQPLSAKFDFNVSVGSNFSEVREFAAAMSELITVSRANGKVSLEINLFDNISDVLYDFINSDKISPELRSELFGLMQLSIEELYSYVSDRNKFTYEKYKSIISAIDFEAIFKNFGIENEPNGIYTDYNALMIKILCQDETKFEETREKLLDRIDSVPVSIKEKTVFDLYDGDGKFSYANKVRVSASAIITKLKEALPALEDFIAVINGAVGNTVFESDVEITVNGPKLYEVTYVVVDPVTGSEVRKTGLLPEGVSVQGFFAPLEKYSGTAIERYDGYRIEKWSLTQDGDAIETIPASDVVLYATLENVKTEIKVYDENGFAVDGDVIKNGVVYGDSDTYTLEVDVIYTASTHKPTITYQWYKGLTLLVGKTEKTLEVYANVAASGEYWCKVTIESDGDLNDVTVDSVVQVITVNPRPVDINAYGFEWNYDASYPFVYNGQFFSVTLTKESLDAANTKGLPAITTEPEYSDIYKSDAGVYYARAHFYFVDAEASANYTFVNSDGSEADVRAGGYVQCEWKILPQSIDSTLGFEWSIGEGESFVYEYGTTHSVSLTLPEGFVVERYDNEAATNAGSYTTVAYVKSSDPNYVWDGGNLTLNWSIEKQLFDLSENVSWDYDPSSPFVYNGSDQGIFVTDVPADIVWMYSGNVANVAGNYVASVEPDPNNALNSQNYIFKGEAPTCAWAIEKQSIESLVALGWNYTEAFTYNGETFTVELNLPEGFDERIVVVYNNNTASDAGTYTATAELVALDSENFEVVGQTISFECEWTVNKAVIDMSGISFKDKFVTETGEPIGIEIEGKLPAGVSVEYSAPVVEVGEYEMTATFIYDEVNYEPIAPMTAKLTIKPFYPYVKDFVSTDSSGNMIVDIKASEMGVQSNYKLNVNDLTAQYYGYDFGNLFGYGTNGNIITVYDIHFAENGTETPVYDVFTVKIRIPETFSGDINKLRVVYINDNGELEDMNAMIDGDFIAYETIHFSVYAIVEVVDRVEESGKIDLLSLLPYGIAALVLIILLIIIIIVIIKKKRKKNKPEEPKSGEEVKPEEPKPEAPAELVAEEVAEPEIEPVAEPEAPVEEEKPTIVIHDSVEDIPEELPSEEGEAPAVPSEIVHVRCRSSFTSRLIQSEAPIQDYYTVLKNALLSYKGVKARMSFNFESFNSGRVQCAKLNVKGKSFLVYLGLDLEEYNVNKYHFSDASDKPKFEKVPMMLKVKSDRSLRYALELIEEVMKKNGFEKDPKFVEQDYHMPYETTAALAEKELVKLILPQGVSLAEGIKLVKADVGALLDEAKSGDEDDED